MIPSMEDLPKDVMFRILSRLRVKTIASCRCVCKTWRKLVSHSSFVKHHLSISPPHACLMVHQRSSIDINKSRTLKLVEFSIDDVIDHHHSCVNLELGIVKRSSNTDHIITPVGSVNGLICLLVNDTKDEDRKVYICNPITNDYKIIPTRYSSDKIVRYGFGVSMAGEYKVIRILQRKHVKDLTEIEVYTLGTDQWRNLGQVPNYVSAIDGTRAGLPLNGRVHWLNRDNIYAFDLDNETVLQIPTPSGEEWTIFPFLGVLKGCLSLFARSQSYDRFSVWVMKEDATEKSWHKTWNTEYYTIYCLEYKIWDPKCLIDGINGTSNLIVLNSSEPRKLVVYCLETGREEETAISHDGRVEIMTLMIYGPSFVKLPKHGVRASSNGSKVKYQHPRQINEREALFKDFKATGLLN